MPSSLKDQIAQWLAQAVSAVAPEFDGTLELDRPKIAEHGEFASSAALRLAKQLKRNPLELARAIQAALTPNSLVSRTEIAGAGFINVFLSARAWTGGVAQALEAGAAYGRKPAAGLHVQVEFVSANPTGPLHVGHGRGAAYGASLANLLEAAGFTVNREYYVNDAGRQMDILALSTWLRYLELTGIHLPFPSNCYQGKYVKEMARAILRRAR